VHSPRGVVDVADKLFARWYSDPALDALPPWPLSDGEIHFLYWFIQGSIMISETRQSLRRGWGFCERHAWAALAVELSFRPKFLHSSALLYQDLLQRVLAVCSGGGPLQAQRLARRLKSQGHCRMCELKSYRAGRGGATQFTVERGRQTEPLCRFVLDHKDFWESSVCGLCRGNASPVRCRRHLIAHPGALDADAVDAHVALLADTRDRLKALAHSYTWGHHGTDRPRDRAALVIAVGFMAGWRPLLALLPLPGAMPGTRPDSVKLQQD
jgi:hypothetical protein